MEKPVLPDSGLIFPGIPRDLLEIIKKAAYKVGIHRFALIGGVVRDRVLHKVHTDNFYPLHDLDLIVEGSACELAKALEYQLGPKRLTDLRLHTSYDTVEMKVDGLSVDLATARIETYSKPGQNPQVKQSSLEEDLSRRDFTINAIALEVTKQILIDPFDGIADLSTRQLKFIHSKSVAEDPTRIIRGARYAARLDFRLAPKAISQVKATLLEWPWQWHFEEPSELAPPALTTRLRLELELLFKEDSWELALENLQQWGGFLLLHASLQDDHHWKRRLRWASRLGVLPLTALVAGAKNSLALADRLQLPKKQQKLLAESLELKKFLSSVTSKNIHLNWSPSQWCNEIESRAWSPDAVAIYICTGEEIWRPLIRWWGRWRLVKSPISGKELMKKGWKPGPSIGAELNRLRGEQIDKQKTTN